jgi:uncharacterized protein (DUF2147 family)
MLRKMIRAGVFALMGMVGMIASYGAATTASAADADISEVMKKSFGKGGYKSSIASAVKGAKWEDAAKLAKEWNELAPALGKNKPPKGDDKSWEKLCGGFASATQGVLVGTEKKDAKAVTKAMSTINCASCHKAHKGS